MSLKPFHNSLRVREIFLLGFYASRKRLGTAGIHHGLIHLKSAFSINFTCLVTKCNLKYFRLGKDSVSLPQWIILRGEGYALGTSRILSKMSAALYHLHWHWHMSSVHRMSRQSQMPQRLFCQQMPFRFCTKTYQKRLPPKFEYHPLRVDQLKAMLKTSNHFLIFQKV